MLFDLLTLEQGVQLEAQAAAVRLFTWCRGFIAVYHLAWILLERCHSRSGE